MKNGSEIKASLNVLKCLPSHLLRQIGQEDVGTSPDMPLKKMAELSAGSKTMHDMFQPVLDAAKLAKPLLKAVVEGNPDQLIELVQKNPQHLFTKGQIKDPSGQVFYNVSAYQMMKYLCDDDMLAKVMPLVPKEIRDEHNVLLRDLKAMHKEQEQTLHHGGADLIKLNFDPTNPPDFDRILRHTETYVINDQQHPATFPLMENPDAILYYKGANDKSNWYYANRETRTIEPIQPQPKTKEDAVIFIELKKSLDAMENNSARRSNDAEHDIIANAMNKRLVRNGIQYEQDGKCCCDTRHDFNRYYNTYRECERLYAARKWDEGTKVWCEKVGSAQKEVMWLLQRYCEKNRPFFPLSDFKSSPFRRSLQIYHLYRCIGNGVVENIYSSGYFVVGFGSDFAVNKGEVAGAAFAFACGSGLGCCAMDLIAVNRLVEDAKANVIEFKPEEALSQRSSIR